MIKLKKLLKEGYAWERNTDGSLPTLADAAKTHAKNLKEQDEYSSTLKRKINNLQDMSPSDDGQKMLVKLGFTLKEATGSIDKTYFSPAGFIAYMAGAQGGELYIEWPNGINDTYNMTVVPSKLGARPIFLDNINAVNDPNQMQRAFGKYINMIK